MEKAQLIISRNRIGTDGEGIRTLVSFAGCPLNCRYCINPHLKKEYPEEMRYTPEKLLEKLNVDRHFFLATGGGVTFSGGEPLLHSAFLKEFCAIADPLWGINIETSLFAPKESITRLLDIVDTWIVDVKTTDPDKYEAYTGKGNDRVLRNLEYLDSELQHRPGKKLVIRVPVIPGYTSTDDVDDTVAYLNSILECKPEFDTFEYVRGRHEVPTPDGMRICEILRAVRKTLSESNGVPSEQRVCTNKGGCIGSCPMCEMETMLMNKALDSVESVNYDPVRVMLEKDFPGEMEFRMSVPEAASKNYMLLGEVGPMFIEGVAMMPGEDESLDEE